MKNRFLLEILTEDIPASLQLSVANFIENTYKQKLNELKISFESINIYHTPRRLIVYIKGLPLTVKEQGLEKKGPAVTAPKVAIDGFLKSCGKYKENEIITKEIKGKDYYFYKQDDLEFKIEDKINILSLDILKSVKFKRSMFWNNTKVYWARPIRNILVIFNNKCLNLEFAGVKSSSFTFGHRFLSDNIKLDISSIDDYFTKLKASNVMYNHNERIDYIISSYNKIAKQRNFAQLDIKSQNENIKRVINLIKEEVAFLVEYPFLIELNYSNDYIKNLPSDLIVETIEKNQKYLAVFSKDKEELLNTFITVSNNFATKNFIAEGNLKVVNARLKDALFFYNDDLEKELDYFYNKLTDIDFFKNLGSYKDKTDRELFIIKEFMKLVKTEYNFSSIKESLKYLKIDIASATVQELPEFQGVFSKYYLPTKNICSNIAFAIASQYKPAGNNDALPQEGLPALIALACKLETLLAFFAMGKNTSGSGDVLGLRRNVLGLIRIILTYGLDINLNTIIKSYAKEFSFKFEVENYAKNLKDFISQRIYFYLKQENYNHYLIKSCFSYLENSKDFNILTAYNNLLCLEEMQKQKKLNDIVVIYKRFYNINKSSNLKGNETLSQDLLQNKAETLLFNFVKELSNKEESLDILEFVFQNIALCNDFFDSVQVNDNNPSIKQNRQLMVNIFVNKLQEIAHLHEVAS